MSKTINKILAPLLVVMLLMLTGCQQTFMRSAKTPATKAVSKAATAKSAPTSAAKTYAVNQAKVYGRVMQDKKSGSKTLLFGIDSYNVTQADKVWLYALAEHANTHDLSIRLDGFTCELGSSEYNVALGFKRAQAVAGVLKSLGVTDDKLILVSYGKEKPVDESHTEHAWRQNRRVEIRY